MNKNTSPVFDKNLISDFKSKFIKYDEREKYLLLCEMVKKVEPKQTETFYRPMLNRFTVIMNEILDQIENKALTEQKIETLENIYLELLDGRVEDSGKAKIILIGSTEECENAEKYINTEHCHIVGYMYSVEEILQRRDIDYFIVCGDLKKIEQPDTRIIRWDLLRHCYWRISPETAYMRIKLEKQKKIRGAVTGLSYEQVGINWERIDRDLCCLAAPSQDLYVDFKKFVWLQERSACKLEYCVMGMSDYALWYDLSLSTGRMRILSSYEMIRDTHHFHEFDQWLINWETYKKVLNSFLIDNYMEVEYEENVHPEKSFELRTGKYAESESDREGDVKEIKRLFAKPYEETFLENKSILQEFFEYLKKNKIRTLVYFPPFPDIFKKNTDITMKRRTRNVIREFQKKYNFDVLDLTEDNDFSDEFFCDWSHLNWLGANLATEKINAYMNKIWI